jgi:DNA (cytosine-5)-methyltransferase 1
MRYLSVCSGIEAASVAWHHLGWTPVGFSEIEPFPAAVLKHRFPEVPNYGDMTQHGSWPIQPGDIDLLVGGTPCQSFSVAGLRKGLEDPRGNLMLTYLAIAARLRPKYLVWENVPGVLSSNGGRDFGTFLGALGELGYGFAYRVLDAQFVRVGRWPRAVPQRRRRVFVVGCLGDGTAAAEVLALEEGLRRHLEAQSKKGKSSSPDAEGGARGGCWWDGTDCAGTLTKQNAGGGQRMPDKDNLGAVLQPIGYRWQNNRDGLQQDDAVAAMRASTGSSGFHEMNHPVVVQPVPFTKSKRAQSVTDDETSVNGQVNPTLSLFDQGDTRATTVAVAFDWQKGNDIHNPRPSTMNVQHECTPTIGTTRTPAVAHALRADGFDASEDGTGRGTPLVPVAPSLTATNDPSRSPQSSEVTQQVAAVYANTMTVRRLTPRECERLQAFPDDYTLIPWRKKQAEDCPDGPRYKALGNSMACHCMAWIGERIAKWEAGNK